MIVIARNKPELAIMSLETLRRWSNRTAAHSEAGSPKALLGLAGLITKGLPADLSIRHNDSIFADLTIEGGQVAA